MKQNPVTRALRNLTPNKLKAVILVLLALILAVIVSSFSILHPFPPHTMTMATGPEGSAYDTFGKRYKKLLAKEGIEVKLVNTAGGVENLKLLRDDQAGVDTGFVEGGLADETESTDPDIVSLGTMCYEPLWLFSSKIPVDRGLFSLRGKRVSVGPEGSDSRALVEAMLKRNKLDLTYFHAVGLTPEQSQDALAKGQIDALVLVSSYASPVVRNLAKAPGVDLADFSRADAYVAMFTFLTKLTLPAGAASLEQDLPRSDKNLLATKTSLIVRSHLHPALQYLLMETATRIHGRHGVFQKAGEFPAAEELEIPLSADARHYYKSGRPFLQRYMPFWLAALVEQLVVLLIPVIGLMYPLVKGLAALYGWGMQRKIFLIYGELHWLESEIDKLGSAPPPPELLARMKQLEERANRAKVSAKYMPMLYSLKDTLRTVRARLDRQGKMG